MEFQMINITYTALHMYPQTEKTPVSCKDDCTLTKHWKLPLQASYSYSALPLLMDQQAAFTFGICRECSSALSRSGESFLQCVRLRVGGVIAWLGSLKIGTELWGLPAQEVRGRGRNKKSLNQDNTQHCVFFHTNIIILKHKCDSS